ncbi:MAG TPA: aminotransferase class I/II-fold pyridoxal phosphate-dependent enzyme [Acidimicrobiales bacterium]|nr:aminotransferase class I/II-fold pyridoxal phosphate-dependent enzyme [Acidimicrobiales bacterium]
MSFTPPAYPYERLDGLKEVASVFEGGAIDCSIGTPIDPPPVFVMEELARGAGARGYPPSAGTPDYREAAASWMNRRFGLDLGGDSLAACVGTKEFVGSLSGYLHLKNPERDTVLYPAISYPTYAMGATLAGLRAVPVAMVNGQLNLSSIEASDVERALVLWANSPSNPTGSLDDLEGLARWGRRHGVLVVSDECYAEFTWASRPRSILEHGLQGVLALHSISKRSNLAGFRSGFYAGDPEVVTYLRSIRQHAGLMVPGPVQAAVALAYRDDEHVEVQRVRYLRRLELLSRALKALDVEAPMPEGSFYLWCKKEGMNGWALASLLAERSGLVVSPGELYGDAGGAFVRIAVVQPDDRLELAASRLEASQGHQYA